MLGGSVSTTVMVWLQKASLPQASLARQVRRALNSSGQRETATLVTVLTISMTTLVPSHTSTAVGRVKANCVPHSASWSPAQVMLGGSVSTTVMVWLQKASLPQASLARQVRRALNSSGQRETATLVTVLTISMTTLVPSHTSTAVG